MVIIDKALCNGCVNRDTALCEDICPGMLFRRGADGKAELRDPGACWDCCSCVKVCPRAALTLQLPFQIAEQQHRLLARVRPCETEFQLLDRDGRILSDHVLDAVDL